MFCFAVWFSMTLTAPWPEDFHPLLSSSISILFPQRGGSDAFNLNNRGPLRPFVAWKGLSFLQCTHLYSVLTTLVLVHSNLFSLLLPELIELRKGHDKYKAFSTCIDSTCIPGGGGGDCNHKMMQMVKEAPKHWGENDTISMKVWVSQGCNYCGSCKCHFEFHAGLVSLGWVIDFWCCSSLLSFLSTCPQTEWMKYAKTSQRHHSSRLLGISHSISEAIFFPHRQTARLTTGTRPTGINVLARSGLSLTCKHFGSPWPFGLG